MFATDFEKILEGKYPAKQHTKRVDDHILSKLDISHGVLYLEGQKTKLLEDNDEPQPFRQRRQFFYLSGCKLPDCSLVHDISTGRTTLFIPPVDADSVIWSGLPMSKEEALQKYDVQEVLYTTETNHTLRTLASNSRRTVFSIAGQVSDDVDFSQFAGKNSSVLKDAIDACRVVKSEYEVALIRKANKVSTAAHLAVLESVSHVANEQELEAIFLAKCVAAGAKEQAYHSIVASGRAAATLHYVRNNQPLAGKLNLLLDAGAEWDCYASDITRTFPISGRFSLESRQIYEIVADMQTRCIAMLHADIEWESVHEMAHRIAIDGLLALGILRGDKDDIFHRRISVAFFPHGLGHYLGMDTHDTGGNPNYSDPDPCFRYLRIRGRVPEGSVVTVEPGIYFCQFIIQPYLEDPSRSVFIDQAVLNKYWDVGGVRLEDNILITKDGFENLTPSECVKSLAGVERS